MVPANLCERRKVTVILDKIITSDLTGINANVKIHLLTDEELMFM
jgi:hypothetical protein